MIASHEGRPPQAWLLETRALSIHFLRVSTKRKDTAACVSLSFIYDFKEPLEPRSAAPVDPFCTVCKSVIYIESSPGQSRDFFDFFVLFRTSNRSATSRPLAGFPSAARLYEGALRLCQPLFSNRIAFLFQRHWRRKNRLRFQSCQPSVRLANLGPGGHSIVKEPAAKAASRCHTRDLGLQSCQSLVDLRLSGNRQETKRR